MKTKRDNVMERLTKGAFVLTLATLVVKLLGLIYKIPLSYILSDEGLGYFNTAYTVYAFFYVISVSGVPKAMSILVPMERDKQGAYSLYRAAHRSFLLIGSALAAFLLVFSFVISRIIGSPNAAFSLIAVAPSIMITAALGVMRGYLNARFSYNEIAISHILEALIKLGAGIGFSYLGVYFGLDVKYCSSLGILGVTVGCGITYFYLMRIIKMYNTEEKAGQYNSRYALRNILKISFPITISAGVMSLSSIIDLFLVIRRLTASGITPEDATAAFGAYTTFVVPMITLANAIISPVVISFVPFISSSLKKSDNENLKKHIHSAFFMCAFISVPIFFGLFFYPFDVLSFVFKDKSAYDCALILSLSSPAVLFITYFTVIATLLEAQGYVKTPIIAVLFGCVMKIVVGYTLIGNNFGILGASLGTIFCYLTASIITSLAFLKFTGRCPPVFSTYFPAILKSVAMIFVTSFIYKRLSLTRGNMISTMFIVSSCMFVYFTLSILEVMFKKKRINIRHNAQKCII